MTDEMKTMEQIPFLMNLLDAATTRKQQKTNVYRQ